MAGRKKSDQDLAEEELEAALETEVQFHFDDDAEDAEALAEDAATGAPAEEEVSAEAAQDIVDEAALAEELGTAPKAEPTPEPAADPAVEKAAEKAGEPADLDERDAEIITLTAERDELKDKLMRALAEAENIRRRAERDRKDAEAFGGTRLARDLLSVHDNLDRALEHADDAARSAAGPLLEGVDLTRKELLSAFAKHKIERIWPEKGDRFDPNLHEAMFEAPIPGAEPGTVIEVMEAGFTISGRLLRPARVGVARAAE